MTLPAVPTDSANEKQHRTIIATVLNELAKQYPITKAWTPVVRGAGTAGTYEIASHTCRLTRMGRRVWADVNITMAATVTGGGTGTLLITGIPYNKAANTFSVGSPVYSQGLDFSTSGAYLSIQFTVESETSDLFLRESSDNASGTSFAISGLSAGDVIRASICYETDDP